MPNARYAKRILHSPDDLLEMVADVEKYPEFVDLISAMRVISREELSDTHTQFKAEAMVAYKGISEQFASEVDVHRDQHKIVVRKAQKGGALKSLLNEWTFHPLPDGSTLVEFYVDVRLKAFFLEGLLKQKFEKASSDIMDRFRDRAAELYEPAGKDSYDASADVARLDLQDAQELA